MERALQTERDASARLRELDDMKDMFLQAVSHDLRTPLTVILGLSLTFANPNVTLSEADDRNLRGRLAANARKLDRILANLLDLDRLIHGVAGANRAPAALGEVVDRVVREAEFLEGRDVGLRIDPVVAYVDAPKVERILENLLANAVKHTPEATPIWVSVSRSGDGVVLAVDDGGPGVPAAMRELVLQPFERGGTKTATPGSGIGLSLVARFAELHGGRAWVEERDGGGASFKVFLAHADPRSMVQAPCVTRPGFCPWNVTGSTRLQHPDRGAALGRQP